MRKPNIYGGGSKTNKNGLSFEGRTDFVNSLKENDNFTLKKVSNFKKTYEVYFKKKKQGYYTEKHEFYNFFLNNERVEWKNKISKQYLPDAVFINKIKGIVFVIEKKFQARSGSVDEKLQTCDFKKKIFSKIISNCINNYKVKYFYLLNDWYEKKEYKDVKEYIKSVGCNYFINEINFDKLGIN